MFILYVDCNKKYECEYKHWLKKKTKKKKNEPIRDWKKRDRNNGLVKHNLETNLNFNLKYFNT